MLKTTSSFFVRAQARMFLASSRFVAKMVDAAVRQSQQAQS